MKLLLTSILLATHMLSSNVMATAGNHDCEECRNAAPLASKHGSTGKWADQAVPHSNWACRAVEDLGAVIQQCQMCDRETVRYVHEMAHRAYQGILKVGCICAGHMEGNVEKAEQRTRDMRNRTNRRNEWLTKDWALSKKGNTCYKITRGDQKGTYVTIISGKINYSAMVGPTSIGTWHATEDAAKLAAFDFMWPART